MTEDDWLTCPMLEDAIRLVAPKASERVLRLFAVACCRDHWASLTDARSRGAVEAAEQFADGLLGAAGLAAARAQAEAAWHEAARQAWLVEAWANFRDTPEYRAAVAASAAARAPLVATAANLRLHGEWLFLPAIGLTALHDVFGNPFRPVWPDETWQTATVTALAETIYAERAFDRLPILADALEDAGCTDAAILDHCRGSGEHVRGCWVVDLALGKE